MDSSSGQAPLTFMEGSGQIIPGLEQALLELKEGDKKQVRVAASEAYGARDEALVVAVSRSQMPTQDIKVGDRFKGGPGPLDPIFVVIGVSDAEVKLDGNHPLAGQDLQFDVQIAKIREATLEEIKHGHAHGEGGHSHG